MIIAVGGEGHGDADALPALLSKVLEVEPALEVIPAAGAMRVGCLGRVLRPGQISRLAAHAQNKGAVALLLVLDCDEGNSVECHEKIEVAIAREHIPDGVKLGIVLIIREWEAMFLTCIESIAAQTTKANFKSTAKNCTDVEAESLRDAKGAVARMIEGGQYIERLHQSAFTACLDVTIFSTTQNAKRIVSVLQKLKDGSPTAVA